MYLNSCVKVAWKWRFFAPQYLKVMKLTVILMIVACLQVSAKVYSQINLSEKNAPLVSVLASIRQQSGYSFFYKHKLLENIKVSANLRNATIQQALNSLLTDQSLQWEINDRTVSIKAKESTRASQMETARELLVSVVISGQVTDTLGTPLIGATVSVTENRRALLTDGNGEFSVTCQSGEQVTISYVGYRPLTFPAGINMPYMKFALRPAVSGLKEVVVNTGYQNISKERATGSFSKPDMEVFKSRTGTLDVIGRLEGLVPGLSIVNNIDEQGERTQSVKLRGQTSIQLTSEPLYVVNGVPVTDFNSINVNDIADVTVLKDASATAIWGARAANGVIVISTQAGDRSRKLKINYKGFYNFAGKPDFGYNRLMNSTQYIQAAKEIFDPKLYPYFVLSNSVITPHEQILYDQSNGLLNAVQTNGKLDSLAGLSNTDQIRDLLYRNAWTTNHTLSVAGGSTPYSFYASASYTGTQTNHPGDVNNRYGLNFNQDINPSSRLHFAITSAITNTQSGSDRSVNIQDRFLPYQLFQDASGNNLNMAYLQGYSNETRADYEARSQIDLDYFPLDESAYGSTKTNDLTVNLVGNAWYKLLPGLSFHGTYGYYKAPTKSAVYDDHRLYQLRKQLLGLTEAPSASQSPVYYFPTSGGTYSIANLEQRNYTLRNQLEYVYSGNTGDHRVNLQLGQEANEQFSQINTSTVYGYNRALQTYATLDLNALSNISDPVDPAGGFFAGSLPFNTNEQKSRTSSYFALGSYTLYNKYSIDASWRKDHSSLIGLDRSSQNRPIYSVGAKWQVIRERFLQEVKWLDNLSLRTTYGITGNSPYTGAASSNDILTVQTSFFGQVFTGGPALLLSTPANRKLNWESTQTVNVGIDFGVLKNRINGSIDFYEKKTTGLLGQGKANPLTGYADFMTNLGNLNNKGIEVSIQSGNIMTPVFRWSTGLLFGYNKNKLVSYEEPTAYLNTAFSRIGGVPLPGYSLNSLFAYQYAGLDNLGDPQIRLQDGTVTKEPDVATASDMIYMGSKDPKLTGGLTNRLSYKNLSLSVNMIYSFGAVMRADVNTFYTGRLSVLSPGTFQGNISSSFADRWKQPGDEAITNIPSYVADEEVTYSRRDVTYYTLADINVVSASFAKIRDLTLSYELPENLLRHLKVEGVSFSLQATNFMLWRANKIDLDPEYQSFDSGAGALPQSKHSYSLGLNVNF